MRKKEIIITSLALISAVLITLGVTLAFFDYAKEGSTENTVTTGTITFLYTEVSGVGKGISLTDAFPISDEVGKSQVGEGNIFDFKITSTTTNKTSIPYEVTARKKSDSTLDDSVVKLYLTKVTGDSEEELLLDNYSNLTQTNKVLSSKYTEKTIYEGIVPEKSTNYEQAFRLRMWIDEKTEFSNGDMNSKTFTLTVNVYANAKVVTEEETPTLLLLKDEIMKNPIIDAEPTLTTSSNNTSDASGLYKSTATNFNGVEGTPTYYFRGNVENNYVSFAGQTWRVVRINEDGTIRMIMANGINNDAIIAFNSNYNDYSYMYYSNSNAKTQLETWYTNNIASDKNYASKVATGNYFCEQAKVKFDSSWTSGSADMVVYSSYTPDFKCSADANGKGLVNASIGLINYDEVVFAGGYFDQANSNYYLYNNTSYWTMSPAGFSGSSAFEWHVNSPGDVYIYNVIATDRLRAVLNLKADTAVTGSGTSTDPYVVQ